MLIPASVRKQYYVTVRYGYHTRILRPGIIQSYAPNFTAPRNTIPNQVNELSWNAMQVEYRLYSGY